MMILNSPIDQARLHSCNDTLLRSNNLKGNNHFKLLRLVLNHYNSSLQSVQLRTLG